MKGLKRYLMLLVIALIFVVLAFAWPETATRSSQVMWDYFKEMALILPPVFILMGLLEVWIPKNKIQKWLGEKSGFKGALIAVAIGTLPTGPLYVAFPMTAALIRKGASVLNMVLFLGAWAALKIPQLMVEVKFLGVPFTLLRFGLTLAALLIMGSLMDLAFKKKTVSEPEGSEGTDKE
jgi:uncharacterized membrane protein YraQ (UPF0718 family)